MRMKKTVLGMVPEDSPMYRLHPLTRLVILLTLGVAPLWIHIPEINLVIIGIALALFRISRVSVATLKPFVPILFTVAFFILFAFTVLNRPAPDERLLVSFLGIGVYYESLGYAVSTYLRIITTVLVAIFYFSTNRERDLLVALRTVRVPFAASYLASLSLRSAGMFLEDVRVVRQAERARGMELSDLPYFQRLKQYALYMVPLFSIALRRSDEISAALTARAFSLSSLREKRPDYGLTRFRIHLGDYALIFVLVSLFLVSVVLGFGTGLLSIDNSPSFRYLARWV